MDYAGATSAAKTFLGNGFIPSDRVRMRQWNEHRIVLPSASEKLIDDLSAAFRGGRLADALTRYVSPDVLVVDLW